MSNHSDSLGQSVFASGFQTSGYVLHEMRRIIHRSYLQIHKEEIKTIAQGKIDFNLDAFSWREKLRNISKCVLKILEGFSNSIELSVYLVNSLTTA